MAKLWFLLAGLLMQLLLPRALGSSPLFGMWTLVLGWLSSVNNVVITATIQAVAHFAAASPQAVEQAKHTALRMNLRVGTGAALVFFLLAPVIAQFEHDPELIPHLRLASGVILAYSFYAVFVGAANGARQFHKQAGLDMLFSTLRTGLVLAAAMVFHATLPAVAAFVVAALLILMVAVGVVGPPKLTSPPNLPVAKMLTYVTWLLIYLSATNALMFLDGWLLKRLCTEAASAMPAVDVKRMVDGLLGYYGAAQTVARLPYQLILAVAFIIFPLLSAPELRTDPVRTQRYISSTLRYSLVVMVAMVAGLGTRPEATLRLLYPAEYSTSAAALAILFCAYICFSLLSILGTIFNSLGRTWQTAVLGILTLCITATTTYLSIQHSLADGQQPLRGAALGLLVGMAAGLLLSLGYLWLQFKATLPPLTLLRVSVAFAVVWGLGRLWPAAGSVGLLGSKVGTLLCASVSGLVYLAVLVVLGELSAKELRMLRKERPAGAASPAT